jgi:ParB family chromosome partitioning protein
MGNSNAAKSAASGPKKRRKQALGRGLDALIPDLRPAGEKAENYFLCPLERIRPNRYQPRTEFQEAELKELSDSIAERGLLQPLLVRPEGEAYELIAGERRLRAARLAGLDQVPVVVREVSPTELLELSIIENIQREDLNPIEEADAYHQLMSRFGLTQEQVAERVGKSRSAVANFLRLRQLPESIKASMAAGALTMGHARALLGAPTSAQQTAAWKTVLDRGLTVRQTERLIRRMVQGRPGSSKPEDSAEAAYFSDLADELSRNFGSRVVIRRRGKKGRVEIEFYSDEDLDRLLTRLQAS